MTGVADQVAALGANAVQYSNPARDRVTLAGATGTAIDNLAPGLLSADSTEAVNGAQLFATNTQVGTNTSAIAALDATAVRYDGADRGTITLGGPAGTTIGNVAPGLLSADSTQAVNGAQLFATNTQVAGNTTAITNLTNGAAGPVRYADAATPTTPNGGTVTDDLTLVGASGGPVRLHNLADGAIAAGSTDAVTGGQLFNYTSQLGLANSVLYDTDAAGARLNRITLAGGNGAAPVAIGNVAAGALTATSTEAVNGSQLFATNAAVGTNTTAITNLDGRVTTNETAIANLTTGVTNNSSAITNLDGRVTNNETAIANLNTGVTNNNTAITNLQTAVANQPIRYADAATPTTPNGGAVSDEATLAGASGGPVGLHNVRAGALAAGSTDAVNGDQLFATNTQVAANTGAITNITNLLVGSTVDAVQYSNPGTPTTPNGGTLTNDVTLVGANPAAAVGLHNVAGGAVSATSTDAVNGQQLFAVSTQASNSIQYDRDAAGARTNTVTLAGGNAAAPVTIANVAAGTVNAASTQAVNGAQLYATNQVAQQGAALGANSVQYDPNRTSVTFTNVNNVPVTLHNVAAGTAATDAVNVGQLQAGMQSAVTQANTYTDSRITALNFDIRSLRRDVGAGTSAGLAAAALPQANEPGRTMLAIGGGTYRGQSAIAFGASTFLEDGHSVLRLGATYDSRGYGGANAGFGYQF